ncbi:hypothetical protein ARMGADRAFT_1014437 [Armillaria gallica]|uniref:Uncharacterized protein n=1 Tax=Armillaria gallica TaxID=47427 RepID=A0A2H3DIT0_ARMGA|nr:hypothetical protein ARMGADRAFT_1014437 [Armillaria gallica]
MQIRPKDQWDAEDVIDASDPVCPSAPIKLAPKNTSSETLYWIDLSDEEGNKIHSATIEKKARGRHEHKI